MTIYIGNLAHDVTEEDLQQAFAAFGQVTSVKIIMDKFTGASRGFGFVEMPSDAEAQSAITGLGGTEFNGHAVIVSEARPRGTGGKERGNGGRR